MQFLHYITKTFLTKKSLCNLAYILLIILIPVIGFDNVEEAIEIANQSCYGLCGCVFTKDFPLGMKIADRLECGGAVINGSSFYRSFEMPFGGWKHSGIGNEGVLTTLQEMSRLKTIVLKNIL